MDGLVSQSTLKLPTKQQVSPPPGALNSLIDATAIISASAIIEKGAVIGDHNLIQQNVTIHRDTLQGSGIYIYW